jgi:hypothetical protein
MNTLSPLKPYKWRVQDGWAELIDRYPWEWFVTLTFTDAIHPEAALKSMYVWLSILNRELFGRRWYKKIPYGVYFVAAIEYQKRGVIHLHLLIAGVKDTRRLTYMDTWAGMGNKNGYARIEATESNMAASRYLSKYVTKDGEIFLSENLPDVTAGLTRLWSEPTTTGSLPASDTPQD